MIVKLEGRQPIFAFRTKNLHFFADGEFEEVFAINSKQDKEKAQLIPSVLTSILTKYCVEFAAKTALSSNLRWLDKADILSLNLWEGDRVFLKYLLEDKKEFFNLSLIYKGESLKEVIKE
ncbi:MAG: hypothetical protein IJN40_08680 [Clostridia bacterium]|nr:hypothetical protein [Clostridia bacterium]